MKHEYTDEELAELKSIYDESGEAGLSRDEMRTLRKAGLLTNGLPAKPAAPSKRDIILAHCKTRIDQGQPVTGEETAEALGMSQKTVGNILSQLRKEGLLPAFDKHSPRSKTRKTTTTEKKETMTNTAIQEQKPQPKPENPRAIITNALVGIYDSISALQRAAYHANDKVVYMFATKLLNGELMDIKANYSKDAK
ncbi:molecular chaperone GrpE [Bifidobacterium pseudocatenulatum]|uniref:molecular chaperone GrpE n=1 Tax=Bifidobacterium pseudocatenulatum TaxID=28026 RepID=UPI0022E847A7|nr:molecular chaperone GrpE [Bifidobacterium pseudocatenulatum]